MRRAFVILLMVFLCGCKSTGKYSVIHPLYEAKTNELAARDKVPTPKEIKQAYKGIPKWLDKEKLTLSGVGENIVDFSNKKISKDSSWKMPFSGASLKDLPTQNVK